MIGKFQPQGGIYRPSSDISLNWSDMRSGFGYKLLSEMDFIEGKKKWIKNF
jgi:hypothetical protein